MINVNVELVLQAVARAEKPYLQMTTDGEIAGYSQSLLHLLEVSEEELSKLVFLNFIPDVFCQDGKCISDTWKNIIEELKSNGKLYRKLYIQGYKGGERRCVIDFFIKGDTIFGFITDITYPTLKKETLLRQMKKIEEINKSLEKFADMVSHDTRNSINVMGNYLILLKNELEDVDISEESKKYLDKITEDLKYIQVYMDGLLRIAKAGEIIGSVDRVDVVSLIRQSHQFVTNIDTIISLITPEESYYIESDSLTLQQVFNNLFLNAYKNRERGKDCILKVSIEDIGKEVKISFADNGTGISEGMIKEIFNYGFTTKKGLGIGLAICSKIIEAHSGKIWAESEGLGKGTTICIILPKKSIVS